ncbi:DUF2809 domain-containing protein [Arthrobacter sp. I2-34]|uniref:DUF2809 domain-containing protein n=1 Tax=Arthrobacter hankyongi TaxID=2904801 RepID=A0ABS9LAM8_9MICC|nr:DUF2809 domain-containing protein [Arthrobacter hankyongi]MCG2623715.1 DUF2809 domain-containing protein [Arthrobacter hankyongi]
MPEKPEVPDRPRTRRLILCMMALATIVLGLSVRSAGTAAWTNPAGDALYAVLVYVVVALLVPRKPARLVAMVAAAVCFAIEFFQLTGLPAELGNWLPPVRLLLGTTFGAADLIAYAGGTAMAYVADSLVLRAARTLATPASPR